ncbi:MAG: hypothetical protein C4297_00250 [Gemmataceae bacterium]
MALTETIGSLHQVLVLAYGWLDRGSEEEQMTRPILLGLAVALGTIPLLGLSADPPAPPTSGDVVDSLVIEFINEKIREQWQANGLTPSPVASKHEFLRRVFLDIVGRIPTVDEINRMVNWPRPKIVQHLLHQDDYAENWANLWTVWLLTRTNQPGIDRGKMHQWLKECFAANKPYDRMVYELLTASGRADENGAVNFILAHCGEQVPGEKRGEAGHFEMVPITSRTTRLFLGIQTQCTQCHDHPFLTERKQPEFWGINAFFRQVTRDPPVLQANGRQNAGVYYTLNDDMSLNPSGVILFEKRNGLLLPAMPTYFDGTKVSPQLKRREELARLLIKDEFFAKAIVNRMWAHFMGRGFTKPVDDFGEHNPVSHPELLDRLARDFAASGYDLKRLVTWICNSLPYQLTSAANKSNAKQDAEPFFARMLLKAMSPEQLVDSIFVATNAEKTKASETEYLKMRETWLRTFTVNFGDDEGNEVTYNGTIIQALMLMNGRELNDAIKARPGSTVQRALTLPPSRRVHYLFLAALSRPPEAAELAVANKIVSKLPPDQACQDILWALLNSNEFILNH